MVSYTRKHFREIASLISKVPHAQRKEEAERYCNMFSKDNPRFDRKKFMDACVIECVGSFDAKKKGNKNPHAKKRE